MSDHAGPSILPAEMRSASLRGYIFGFAGSIVLTVAAYLLLSLIHIFRCFRVGALCLAPAACAAPKI